MNVVVDIGNTRTKIALFHKNQLYQTAIHESNALKWLSDNVDKNDVKAAILSATGQDTEGVENYLKTHFRFIKFDHHTPIPIENTYKTPETLGKDRLAAVIAAHSMFPNSHSLVIDSGTRITYNFINDKGAFLGGNISPGLTMRLKAMHHFTARLPDIAGDLHAFKGQKGSDTEGVEKLTLIGTTTETAMLTGAKVGLLSEVEGMIQRFSRQYSPIQVIFTGGDGAFLAQHIAIDTHGFDRYLVLKGLNQILNYNISD